MSYICLPKGDFHIFKRKNPNKYFKFLLWNQIKSEKEMNYVFLYVNRKVGIYILFLYLCVYKESSCMLVGQKRGKRLLDICLSVKDWNHTE